MADPSARRTTRAERVRWPRRATRRRRRRWPPHRSGTSGGAEPLPPPRRRSRARSRGPGCPGCARRRRRPRRHREPPARPRAERVRSRRRARRGTSPRRRGTPGARACPASASTESRAPRRAAAPCSEGGRPSVPRPCARARRAAVRDRRARGRPSSIWRVVSAGVDDSSAPSCWWRPRQDSNLRTRLRRPALYPLSYEGEAGSLATGLRRTDRTYARPMAPKVLLVDDEKSILMMLDVNFRAAGFDVMTATSGASALEIAAAARPDAVVLDLGLPDLDGWEVVKRLRELDGVASTPVVVLSGTDRNDALGRGYASAVEAYVSKPVEPDELVQTVRRVLARSGG